MVPDSVCLLCPRRLFLRSGWRRRATGASSHPRRGWSSKTSSSYLPEADDDETEPIPLQGRSDHAAFAGFGIPVGSVFTGANMLKTRAEVRD